MKNYILALLLLTSIVYSQPNSENSFYELKQSVKDDIFSESAEPSVNFNYDVKSAKKKTGLAILYSLLLPGMGELYAEAYSSGMYFTIAEGALWGTYIGMNTYANWQKDRYEGFAITKAGIDPATKDKDYYSRIGLYTGIEQYNDQKALERNFDEMYDPGQYFWKWSSTEERRTYRDMWLSSEQAFNDIRFVVGAMLLNRLASAVNAVRLVAKYNNRLEEQSWNISVGTIEHQNLPSSLSLNFYTSF